MTITVEFFREGAGPRPAGTSRVEFIRALDAAQREGVTIDGWFALKFADPSLSARADWAGLNDDANAAATGRR